VLRTTLEEIKARFQDSNAMDEEIEMAVCGLNEEELEPSYEERMARIEKNLCISDVGGHQTSIPRFLKEGEEVKIKVYRYVTILPETALSLGSQRGSGRTGKRRTISSPQDLKSTF
jgi:hypothetical protein